ncbi:MAG: hypothetical protein HZA20_13935 [Nitrospirae bacterium]|nr:hypothetical protein [Nitrospirota bacterium]
MAMLLCALPASAEDAAKVVYRLEKNPPYGTYTPESGGWYGHKRPILNDEEAAKILSRYYETRGLKVGNKLREHKDFFQAEVYRGDTCVDRVIIHKATGRIRSLY